MSSNTHANRLSFYDKVFIGGLTVTILISCYYFTKRIIKDYPMISNLTSNIRIVPAVLVNENVQVEPSVPELPQ